MALGSPWLTVPGTIVVDLCGARQRFVTGKDLILEVLRRITVEGATDRCLEFTGSTLGSMNMDERMALCNMTAEAGAKTCLVPVDAITDEWCSQTHGTTFTQLRSDEGAHLHQVLRIDVDQVRPLCAHSYSPDNVHAVEDSVGIKIDQVYIGNGANGTLTDLRHAASVLRGRRVADGVRCIVVPATQPIFREAIREGLIEALVDAASRSLPRPAEHAPAFTWAYSRTAKRASQRRIATTAGG